MNWKNLLLEMGISDVAAFTNFVTANSKTGPQFKAAAENATTALAALALAAQNPNL